MVASRTLSQPSEQITEAIRTPKCHRCGCLQKTVEALANTEVGRNELAQFLAKAKSVFAPLEYDCLGCPVCYPAIAANAFVEAHPETAAGLDLCPMKRGEKWDPGAPEFTDLVNQYPVFLKRMISQGKVAVAGPLPFAVPGELRGVAIFRVPAEQATKLMQDDAAVKAGLLKLETHPWITAIGVLAPGLTPK
jgi:hypothetical protein